MHQFLTLNKTKILFSLKVTSLVFSAFIGVLFTLAYWNGVHPDVETIGFAILIFSLFMPCFIVFGSGLAWHYKHWAKRRAFSRPPFDQLKELGFSDTLLAEKSRWSYTEVVKTARINGFAFMADVRKDDKDIIELRAFVEWKQLDKKEYGKLSKELNAIDIELELDSMVKRYNLKKSGLLSVEKLKNDLEQFTELIREKDFKSAFQLQHESAPLNAL